MDGLAALVRESLSAALAQTSKFLA